MQTSLRESLAGCQHEIWSHWMRYLFSCCTTNEDGSVTIPTEKVERWKRQMETSYEDLTTKEQESGRHQADKVLAITAGTDENARDALTKQIEKEIAENFKGDSTFIPSVYFDLRMEGTAAKDIEYDDCHIFR